MAHIWQLVSIQLQSKKFRAEWRKSEQISVYTPNGVLHTSCLAQEKIPPIKNTTRRVDWCGRSFVWDGVSK